MARSFMVSVPIPPVNLTKYRLNLIKSIGQTSDPTA